MRKSNKQKGPDEWTILYLWPGMESESAGKKTRNSRLYWDIRIGAVKSKQQKEITDHFCWSNHNINGSRAHIHEVIHVDYKDLMKGVPLSRQSEKIYWLVRRRLVLLPGKSGRDGTSREIWSSMACWICFPDLWPVLMCRNYTVSVMMTVHRCAWACDRWRK